MIGPDDAISANDGTSAGQATIHNQVETILTRTRLHELPATSGTGAFLLGGKEVAGFLKGL